MKVKLLILLISALLISGCYTHFNHAYRDTDVDDVYIYDVNYVYNWDYYDDPFWRYDVRFAGYHDYWWYSNWYISLHFYSPRYYQYPYWNRYEPYHRHHWYRQRPFHRRSNVVYNQHYKPKRHLMSNKTNIKKLRQKYKQSVQVKPKIKRKFNTWTKKRDQVVTTRKWNDVRIMSGSKNTHKISPRKTTRTIKRNVHKMSGSQKRSTIRKAPSTNRTRSKSKRPIKTRR